LVAHAGNCLGAQMVQRLSAMVYDKVSSDDCAWLRCRKVSQETMVKKQKHWQLSLEYSK